MAKAIVDEKDAAVKLQNSSEAVKFLVHDLTDTVGVAVEDIQAGEKVNGLTLDGQTKIVVAANMEIPLGHKVALRDFKPGEVVVKYGEKIGIVVAEIRKGDHVHVHNLKTARW